jgi:hypothetical protein
MTKWLNVLIQEESSLHHLLHHRHCISFCGQKMTTVTWI